MERKKKTKEERLESLKKMDEFRKRLNDVDDVRERARRAPDYSKESTEAFIEDLQKKVATPYDPETAL